MAAQSLVHLTLNSGHTRQSPRSEVADAIVAMLAPLARSGGALPVPGYSVTIVTDERDPGAAAFTVRRDADGLPLVTCFCCWDATTSTRYWGVAGAAADAARQQFGGFGFPERMPRRPRDVPWLAVLIWPSAVSDPGATSWLGDFERCMAWALIERR